MARVASSLVSCMEDYLQGLDRRTLSRAVNLNEVYGFLYGRNNRRKLVSVLPRMTGKRQTTSARM